MQEFAAIIKKDPATIYQHWPKEISNIFQVEATGMASGLKNYWNKLPQQMLSVQLWEDTETSNTKQLPFIMNIPSINAF